jgi:hypothetical protein
VRRRGVVQRFDDAARDSNPPTRTARQPLYVGRARSLRRRITALARFGSGQPVGHWGGRYLWQLADHEDLAIAWRTSDEPVALEASLERRRDQRVLQQHLQGQWLHEITGRIL